MTGDAASDHFFGAHAIDEMEDVSHRPLVILIEDISDKGEDQLHFRLCNKTAFQDRNRDMGFLEGIGHLALGYADGPRPAAYAVNPGRYRVI